MLISLITVGCGDSKKSACASETTSPEIEVLGSETLESVCEWKEDLPAQARPGARIFATSGCLSCHTYRGVGSRNVGGRDLTAAGQRHDASFFERYVRNPADFGNNVMPRFRFPPRQLRQVGLFLAASRGQT
jgi:cbb3-type cytochrome oxidase cytochrome c subunit